MNKILFRNDVNLEQDELLAESTIKLKFIDGCYSIHKVSKYRVKEGEFKDRKYYVFDWIDGKSIMNYNYTHYQELYKYLDVSFEETIFQMSSKHQDFKLKSVSEDYRFMQ